MYLILGDDLQYQKSTFQKLHDFFALASLHEKFHSFAALSRQCFSFVFFFMVFTLIIYKMT